MQTRSAQSAKVGRIALAIIFLGLVPIFIYEAVGVYQPPSGLEPITYYVRCAIWIDTEYGNGIRTLLLILFISFLFGQWLWAWHPVQNQYRGRFGSGTRELARELATKRLSDMPRPRIQQARSLNEGAEPDASQPAS